MLHIVQNKLSFSASWARTFGVTLFFVTLAAGLFWLDYFRSYQAEVTILVISRPGATQDETRVAENLTEITRTLSFYNRVLADNDLIDDAFLGYAPDKRKALWNDMVSVKKIDGSSTVALVAVGSTQEEASLLAEQSAQTLFSVAGFYYNVKTEIDLRIIDGPLLHYVVVKPLQFVLVSFFSGFFATAIFFFFLNVIPGFIGERKKYVPFATGSEKRGVLSEQYAVPEKSYPEFVPGDTVPRIDPRKFIPTKPKTLSFEGTAQRAKNSGMRAPAPANLPVASDEMDLPVMDETAQSFPFEVFPEEPRAALSQPQEELFDLSSLDEHIALSEISGPTPLESNQAELASAGLPLGEPTVEEYKRRLNKLLSGSN